MADQRRRSLLPSKLQKNRTLVIFALIAVAAIIIVVAALALATNYAPGGSAPTSPYAPGVRSGQSSPLRVDSVTVDQNFDNSTAAFNVTVTNTGDARLEGNLSVQVYRGTAPPAPNQPYPNQDPSSGGPDPTSTQAVTSTRPFIALEPGETKSVEVTLNTPPGFTVNPSDAVVTFA